PRTARRIETFVEQRHREEKQNNELLAPYLSLFFCFLCASVLLLVSILCILRRFLCRGSLGKFVGVGVALCQNCENRGTRFDAHQIAMRFGHLLQNVMSPE